MDSLAKIGGGRINGTFGAKPIRKPTIAGVWAAREGVDISGGEAVPLRKPFSSKIVASSFLAPSEELGGV